MKAQAAFEYMLMAVLVLAFVTPLWIYMVSINTDASDELTLAYAKNAVNSITSGADLVYSQGPPAKIKVSINVPDGVLAANLTNHTAFFRINHYSGVTHIYALSKARLNGTIPTRKGTYLMEIRAVDNAEFDIDVQRAT